MSTVLIDLAYGKAALRGESLHVVGTPWRSELSETAGEHISRILPLVGVEHLLVSPGMSMSGALLNALLQRGIGVTFLGQSGPVGELLPATPPKGDLRLRQYRCCGDADWCLRQARVPIATKIFNQAYMLRRRKNPPADAFFKEMKRLQKAVAAATNVPELMGIEGMASALYFAEWAAQLPPAFPFGGRSRRPPLNPVNACLSYLSALCAGDMLRALLQVGLDPDLGVLHSTADYRHNLVLDLMEPYRPVLVEGVTRDILTHGLLDPESTEQRDDGGCYLTAAGRVCVIRRYEQRMESAFQQGGSPTTLRKSMVTTARCWRDAVLNPQQIASNFKLG